MKEHLQHQVDRVKKEHLQHQVDLSVFVSLEYSVNPDGRRI